MGPLHSSDRSTSPVRWSPEGHYTSPISPQWPWKWCILFTTLIVVTGEKYMTCSKASELNVKDKEKYNFDPKKLLSQIASIILRVWTQECRQTQVASATEFLHCSYGEHFVHIPNTTPPYILRSELQTIRESSLEAKYVTYTSRCVTILNNFSWCGDIGLV